MRAVSIAAVALSLPSASWGTAITARPSIHVTPASVPAGGTVRVYGRAGGCPRGDAVTLISKAFRHVHDFAGLPAVYARVTARDRYSVRTHIPRSRRAGRYSISARCGGGTFGVHATLRVERGR